MGEERSAQKFQQISGLVEWKLLSIWNIWYLPACTDAERFRPSKKNRVCVCVFGWVSVCVCVFARARQRACVQESRNYLFGQQLPGSHIRHLQSNPMSYLQTSCLQKCSPNNTTVLNPGESGAAQPAMKSRRSPDKGEHLSPPALCCGQ